MDWKHVYERDFASLEDMLQFLAAPPVAWGDTLRASQCGGREGWAGTKTYKAAERLARDGWPEGRETIKRALALMPAIQTVTSRLQVAGFDVAGAYPIVPMAVAGEPACMATVGEQERITRPYLRFEISTCGSSGVGADIFATRGAAVVSWIDALEQAGARCEVVAIGANDAGMYACVPRTMIKRADEHVDIDRLAFVFMNPAMHRRFNFAFIEHSGFKDAFGMGYGKPCDAPRQKDAPPAVVLGKMYYGDKHWHSAAAASEFVRQEILQACGDLGGMLDAA